MAAARRELYFLRLPRSYRPNLNWQTADSGCYDLGDRVVVSTCEFPSGRARSHCLVDGV